MIGFEATARGNQGTTSVSPWSEGSVGLSPAVNGFTQQAIGAVNRTEPAANFDLNLTVDGRAATIRIDGSTTAADLARQLTAAGCGENVVGFITRQITNHCQLGMGGDGGTTNPLTVDVRT